jgi:hypothetical protein
MAKWRWTLRSSPPPAVHGKRVLGGEERATECAVGECHFIGMHASKQNLGKGSDSAVVTEGKARSEEIAEGGHVGVVHVNGIPIRALESDLRVRVGAKVANDSQIAVDVESEEVLPPFIHTSRFPAASVGTARR